MKRSRADSPEASLGERTRITARAISAVGHAIAGPAQALTNRLFLLHRRLPPEAASELINIEAELDGLRSTIDRLLILPFVHAGLNAEPSIVASIVQDSLARLGADADERRVTVAIDHADAELWLDRVRLAAALSELLRNGLESAPGARVSLQVSASPARVSFTIDDDGVPEWPDPVELAFDPLYTTRARSLGLGLTVARTVAAAHGGSVTIAPREGGTRVNLAVPSLSPDFNVEEVGSG